MYGTKERYTIMNEKDPKESLPQAHILTPETVALKQTESVSSSEDMERSASKNNRGTKILIGSLATLLIAGSVTVGILAKSGAFSKTKEVAETETSATSSSETKAETKASETTTTTTTDPTSVAPGKHQTVRNLSQVTDDQLKIMDESSRNFIRKDGHFDGDGIPDEVTIDGMYYLGMLIERDEMASSETTESNVVQLVYQVQVTDNTEPEPVKRQFFWMYGFSGVYDDGTIDPTKTTVMRGTLCFDHWSSHGSLDLTSLMRETEFPFSLKEKRLDDSLVQPFDGEVIEKLIVVKSLDQITAPMEEGLKKGAREWQVMQGIVVGAQDSGLKIENIEYAGLALANSTHHNENKVYIIYKLDIIDLNQTPPVKRNAYWYITFGHVYQGGQIQTSFVDGQTLEVSSIPEMLDKTSSIEDLRDYITTYEALGWDYEDHLEQELYTEKKATTKTETN